MFLKNRLPVIVLGMLVLSVTLLSLFIHTDHQTLISIFYVLFILALGILLLLNVMSSLLLLLGKFDDYWYTNYPVILLLMYASYGLLKSSGQLIGLTVFSLGLLLGVAISYSIKSRVSLRVVPLLTLIVIWLMPKAAELNFVDRVYFFRIVAPLELSIFTGIILRLVHLTRKGRE